MSRIRNAARMLLTLYEKDPRRVLEGKALLRRMNRYGLLDENQNMVNYVLALTGENILERCLQTLIFKTGMAKSIHQARVLIKERDVSPLTESASSVGAALPAPAAESGRIPMAEVFKFAVSSF